MKILLINPPTADEKNITSFMYPPMGLIAIAGYLRSLGHEVNLIDANIAKYQIEDMYDLVGIGAMSVNINRAFDIARQVKEINENTYTVLGGIHPTIDPIKCCKDQYVDFVIFGEGEITIGELVTALENKKELNNIDGLCYKGEVKVIKNSPRKLIENLDSLPFPAYDLLRKNTYRAPYTSRTPFACMIRSRGCPFFCTFCGVSNMFGHKYRVQSPKRSIEEVDYLIKEYKVKEIGFKDSEFTIDVDNVMEFCDLLIERNYDLTWNCNGRANHADRALLDKMYAAGCRSITFGVESGDQRILDIMKKQITLQQVWDAVQKSKEAGLQVITNFMIGNPYDTEETIQRSIDFAVKLDTDYANFGYTTPFPGTELREQAVKNNWLLDSNFSKVKYEECAMNATCISTKELSKKLDKAYISFYFRPSFILRRLKRLSKNEIYNSVRGLLATLQLKRFSIYTAIGLMIIALDAFMLWILIDLLHWDTVMSALAVSVSMFLLRFQLYKATKIMPK